MKKMVFVIVFLFLFGFGYGIKFEPIAAYPNEKVILKIEEKAEKLEFIAFYNESQYIECRETNCPRFENNELSINGNNTGIYKIFTQNSNPGYYLIKIELSEEGKTLYSSLVVKQNLFLLNFVVVFLSVVFLVALVVVEVYEFKSSKKPVKDKRFGEESME